MPAASGDDHDTSFSVVAEAIGGGRHFFHEVAIQGIQALWSIQPQRGNRSRTFDFQMREIQNLDSSRHWSLCRSRCARKLLA